MDAELSWRDGSPDVAMPSISISPGSVVLTTRQEVRLLLAVPVLVF